MKGRRRSIFGICSLLTVLVLLSISPVGAFASPVLNFTDVISGPQSGNTDGAGGLTSSQHGTIVTAWGNYSGSSIQVYFTDSLGVKRPAAHVYYEKIADGNLPGGPSDLYTYHKMREVAFSLPAASANGAGQISITADGVASNSLPFTVRAGKIFFIRAGGDDVNGDGSWSRPWATMASTMSGNNGKIAPGDIVYNVGVNSNEFVIGSDAALVGSPTTPFSVIAYPNTRVTCTGGTSANGGSVIRNWYNANTYWNFSKLKLVTIDRAISCFKGARYTGDEITVPNGTAWTGGSMSGAIGCGENDSGGGGLEMLGLYIHDYGLANGTSDTYHHLFYVSNRTGSQLAAYEIAWGNFINNPIYQGIHIYDTGVCGGWTGTFRIHHNVVKNQRANSFNFNPDCGASIPAGIELHDNLFIADPSYPWAQSPIRIESTGYTGKVNIYNNTIEGYGASSKIFNGTVDYRNNILVDTHNLDYFTSTTVPPASNSNNIFFSSANSGLAAPPWASNYLKSDPLFTSLATSDYTLQANSPAINAGSSTVLASAPADFFSQPRVSGQVNIGALPAKSAATTAPAPADTTPPTASVSSPTAGSTVSGTVNVSVAATDNVGVSKVQLYLNNTLLGTLTGSPYTFAWNTTSQANGSYTLVAKAYDAAGNVGTSSSVGVTVSNTVSNTVAASSITASAGTGGTISPSGTVSVPSGGSQSFTITPASGYKIAAVTVDGASVGAVSSYTFSNVTANHTIAASFTSTTTATGAVFAVNSGGPQYTSSTGDTYLADAKYSGGSLTSTSATINGTTDGKLYQTGRYGNFYYQTSLPNGNYKVTLRFAETYFSASGKRVFNVAIGGTTVISNLDVYAKAGMNNAYDVTIPVTVSNGTLTIKFISVVNNALVHAVMVKGA
ncbi:hypothetical protein GMSM_08870 [Geomonas sp. Red276]